MIVEKRFHLSTAVKSNMRDKFKPAFGFNGFGEITYYRTYSRSIRNDEQFHPDYPHQMYNNENWLDTTTTHKGIHRPSEIIS